MKSLSKLILVLSAGLALGISSCANGSDDSVLNSAYTTTIQGLKFDFSGAKALAAVDSSSGGIQAVEAEADSPLIKIMSDGNGKPAVTVPSGGRLSKVKKIYKSPVNTSDVYIVFDQISWIWNNETNTNQTLGQFICVHANGTIADILKKPGAEANSSSYDQYYSLSSSDGEPVFDASGNTYFLSHDNDSSSSTTVICKFNPNDNSITELTAGASGTNYNKFIITSDGYFVIASGSRYSYSNTSGTSASFLRAIPVNDPNHPININYGSYSSNWEYDDTNGICYFNSEKGLSKAVRNGNTFQEPVSLEGFESQSYSNTIMSEFSDYDGILDASWNEKFLDIYGKLKAASVVQYLFNSCWTSGEKEFRLSYFQNDEAYSDLYSELKDEAAVEWINETPNRRGLFYKYITSFNTWNSTNSDKREFLKNIIFKKNSSETAYRKFTDEDNKINHTLGSTNFTNSDGLWTFQAPSYYSYGSTNNSDKYTGYIVHITDSKGYPIWEAKKINLPIGKVSSSHYLSGAVYLSYALLTSTGAETGYQQIYKISLDTYDYKNLFENVPNSQTLEVVSYSVGSDLLYYSAVRGTAVENGIVSVISGEYNPLPIKKRLAAIYAY